MQAAPRTSVHPRRLVRPTLGHDDLPGQQQLASTDHRLAGGEPLAVVGVVTAAAGVVGCLTGSAGHWVKGQVVRADVGMI